MPRPVVTKPRSWPRLAYGDGTWHWNAERRKVELRHVVDGKRYRERGDTPADCITARNRRRHQATTAVQEALTTPEGAISLRSLLERWFAHQAPGRAPQTADKYRWNIELVADWAEDREARAVGVGDLEDLFSDLIAEGYSASSLTALRSTLRQAFAYGVRLGHLATNPVVSMVMPGGARRARSAVWLDETEFAAMRQHLVSTPSTLNSVLLLMLLTGLRPGEALGLCWDAVDMDRARLTVATELQRSKGGRVLTLVRDLKTVGSRRTVELPADVLAILRRERVSQAERRLRSRTWVSDELAFTTDSGRRLDFAHLARACRQACKTAGVKVVSPNGLRHSCASMLLHLGIAAPAVARQLGHANVRMVASTYGHSMFDVVPTAALLAPAATP